MSDASNRATILEAHAITVAALGRGFTSIGHAGFGDAMLKSVGRALSIAAADIQNEAVRARREAGQ